MWNMVSHTVPCAPIGCVSATLLFRASGWVAVEFISHGLSPEGPGGQPPGPLRRGWTPPAPYREPKGTQSGPYRVLQGSQTRPTAGSPTGVRRVGDGARAGVLTIEDPKKNKTDPLPGISNRKWRCPDPFTGGPYLSRRVAVERGRSSGSDAARMAAVTACRSPAHATRS